MRNETGERYNRERKCRWMKPHLMMNKVVNPNLSPISVATLCDIASDHMSVDRDHCAAGSSLWISPIASLGWPIAD